ncbi:MAG TPA: hypothetical protein VEH31_38295 [Streptosporangiaceae bacterium]|nr:hypothetical protein [Streptosporangiaceae bacterium]
MPTVTIEGNVALQQAATALQDRLGSRYEVTTHGSGAQQALKVKQSAASTATVHLDQDGDATTFHVHGGGLVISRMVNEFGIAKKVAEAIAEAFGRVGRWSSRSSLACRGLRGFRQALSPLRQGVSFLAKK